MDNEIFGLLGPNGAGKTTLIHILATLIKPTSGTAIINGFDVLQESSKVRSTIGIVFQAPSSDDMLTGYENLKIHAYLYKIPSNLRKRRIKEFLDLVGLYERRNDRVKKYSSGLRRRLEIARGLLHKPKVMFLDEPTLGLDPSSRETMWIYITKLVTEEKITIILTTHYMEEADSLCNKIGIIDKGQIIALDSPSKLKESIGGELVVLKFDYLNIPLFYNIKSILNRHVSINKIGYSIVHKSITIYVDNARAKLPIIIRVIDKLNVVNIVSVDFNIPTLNDVFLKSTGRQISDQHEGAEGGFMERYVQYGKE